MKNLLKILTILIITLSIFSCSKEDDMDNMNPTDKEVVDNPNDPDKDTTIVPVPEVFKDTLTITNNTAETFTIKYEAQLELDAEVELYTLSLSPGQSESIILYPFSTIFEDNSILYFVPMNYQSSVTPFSYVEVEMNKDKIDTFIIE